MSFNAVRRSKSFRKLCESCRERKARFAFGGRIKADRDHTLCFECHRAQRERHRATLLTQVKPAMLLASFRPPLTSSQVTHRMRMLAFAESRSPRAAHR